MTDKELMLPENQWKLLHDVMEKVWHTMNGVLNMPPNFPKSVMEALDENIRIMYFDLLRMYDVTETMATYMVRPGFQGYYQTFAEIQALPIARLRHGDFSYCVEPIAPNKTGNVWVWNFPAQKWEDTGVRVPDQMVPVSTTPTKPDALIGKIGTIFNYAMADHQHPFSPEFNQALKNISDLMEEIQEKYVKPSTGIPFEDLEERIQILITLGTKGSLFYPVLADIDEPPLNARIDDFIMNSGIQNITAGNLSMGIGDIAQINSLNPFVLSPAGNIRGTRGLQGIQGTLHFPVTANTSVAPANSRINDIIFNAGTTNLTIGGVTAKIGDIAIIVQLNPLVCQLEGNIRGEKGATPVITIEFVSDNNGSDYYWFVDGVNTGNKVGTESRAEVSTTTNLTEKTSDLSKGKFYYYQDTADEKNNQLFIGGADNKARKAGSVNTPLIPETIVYSTNSNLKSTLESLYGGLWHKVVNPAPRTLVAMNAGNSGQWYYTPMLSNDTNRTVQINLSGVLPGSIITVSICGVTYTTVTLNSSIRGILSSITSGDKFSSVTLMANEQLFVTGKFSNLFVSWSAVQTTEYIYYKA